jgi:distribution and morphology protein 12
LWLETELQLNIPSPSFISLPMRLHLSHLRFSGTLLVAYLTHYNTLSYSFRHSSASFSDSEDAGDAKNNEEVTVDLRIESELGDRERQVMKNVAKIERFLVDLIRRLVTEDLAYPNCRSIRLFRHTGGGGEQYFPGVDADLDFGQSAFSDYEID